MFTKARTWWANQQRCAECGKNNQGHTLHCSEHPDYYRSFAGLNARLAKMDQGAPMTSEDIRRVFRG